MQLHPQYYYQQLPPPERAAYHGMLTCLRELAPSARIPRLTMETLGTLFFQLRLDHPEIFYAVGFSCRAVPEAEFVDFCPEYRFEKKRIREHRQAIEARTARLLRPLRSQVSANVPAIMTLREILDGIIIAYTSFCLEGDKKAPGDNFLITGWHLTDACEIWLEALKRTGQGHRIDVLPVPPAALAPEIFPQRNWLLVTSGNLSAARQRQVELWQQQVVSLEIIPL